jgi:hypothetical protein
MTMDFGTWSGEKSDCVTQDVNVSNYNAGVILRALELYSADAFSCGDQLEIDEFLKRLDRAESEWEPGDEGEEPSSWGHEEGGGARFHHMGRRPGYLNTRFGELREMAEAGRRRGHRFVVWF